jgi:hypothetical protein
MRGRVRVEWMMVLGLVGCGDPIIELSIGITEDDRFEPLADGEPIEILIGPQAGIMLAPALQARNLNPGMTGDDENPNVHWSVFVAGELETEQLYRLPFRAAGESGVFDRRGIPILLPSYSADTVEQLEAQQVTLSVEVNDADGGRGTGEVSVIATRSSTGS